MKGLNEIKNALIAFAKKAKFSDAGKAINAKVKGLTAAQIGKIAGAAELANLFDSAVDNAPILTNIYKWWAQTVDAIYSNTVYKIPAVGDFIRMASDFLGKLVVPNAQRHIQERRDKMNNKVTNSPTFYEHLDLHKTFSIPGAYTKKTMINGTMGTPKIVVHRLYANPNADSSAAIDRCNQKFTLIKAVRGLSAVQYSTTDLFNYERFVKYCLTMYYTTKKVVSAAKTYSLVQTQIGDNIIDAYGFVPSEVRQNLANYETLLCQMHRFIENNLPVTGTWEKRLNYLITANIPDYQDAKVATIHMYAVSISHIFISKDAPALVFDAIPHAENNSYAVMLQNFNTAQRAIAANDMWQQLIADYFGAFGAQAIWTDKDYPKYKDPLDLRNGDTDLNREQIKNAFYVNTAMTLITITEGLPNVKFTVDLDDPTPVQLNAYQFPGTFNSTSSVTTALTYDNILMETSYLEMTGIQRTTIGSQNKLLVPDMNGVGAQIVTATNTYAYLDMTNHETIYTLHKDVYSEGEALEISQFKSRTIGVACGISDSDDYVKIQSFHKCHEYALLDSTVYTYADSANGIVESRYHVYNASISDDDLTTDESPIDTVDEIMCWTLIDWMPLVHYTVFYYDNTNPELYFPRDLALLDIDAFGSLDDRAFATSINYSIYSLLAADLSIGKKRVDNLGAVYKNKANKQD